MIARGSWTSFLARRQRVQTSRYATDFDERDIGSSVTMGDRQNGATAAESAPPMLVR
jgi:hypothetical protein